MVESRTSRPLHTVGTYVLAEAGKQSRTENSGLIKGATELLAWIILDTS